MSWLLETLVYIISLAADPASEAEKNSQRRPRWLYNMVLIGYYFLLPVVFVPFVFVSWKIAPIISGVFVAALISGAMVLHKNSGKAQMVNVSSTIPVTRE